MATFAGYAEVLTPQHILYKMYKAGIKKTPPGERLANVLEESGGVYEVEARIPDDMRNDMRRVAEFSSDTELLSIANRGTAPISLEHLRGVDPQTLIVYGHNLRYTEEEGERLRQLEAPPDLNSKNSMYWDRTPK
jgi:hypothetical protein